MKISIQNKLLFLFILSLAVALATSLGIHFTFFRSYYLNHIENRLHSVFLEIEESFSEDNFEEIIAEIDFRQQVGVIITDGNFDYHFFPHLLTDSTQSNLIAELAHLIAINHNLLESAPLCIELKDPLVGTDEQIQRMVFIQKLPSGLYCILSHPLETLESSMDAMTRFHLVAGVVACLFGAVSTLFFSKNFTKPILEINQATQQMSQLDFQQRIHCSSQDELGELSNNINVLAHTLEEYKTALKKEIDFQKILSQNMSHELKTPISVMKGYLEAISYGIAEKNGKVDQYNAIILNECNQMTVLIDQMLELSMLNSSLDGTLEITSFSSAEFADKINNQHKNLLHQHEITFIQKIEDVTLWGNQELLAQSIGNFITNAVKYGDGNQIIMQIDQSSTHYRYSLFNTGTPIPDDELTRVFDVFYMVDKARSREKNSHGLGLTLSKSVAELHHGFIYCENTDQGVTFYIELPKQENL